MSNELTGYITAEPNLEGELGQTVYSVVAGVKTFKGRSGNVVPANGDYTASMVGALPASTVIPTKTSDLTNDSGFITNSALEPYSTTTEMNQAIANHHDATKANVADLAEVATSGDYDDLTNKPTIPVVPTNISAFVNDVPYLTEHQSLSAYRTASAQDVIDATKAKSADLATVATSGAYNDLTGKPTIPVVPTNVSAFTNDAGYLTSHQSLSAYRTSADQDVIDATKAKTADLASVATSGAYADLSGKPSIPTKTSDLTNDSSFTTSSEVSTMISSHHDSTKANVDDLATVATTGSYSDLVDKPTIPGIPQNISYFVNDVPYLTQHQSLADYSTTTQMNTAISAHHDTTKQDVISDLADIREGAELGETAVQPAQIADMASKTWVGQQGYLTQHQSLANYALVSETGNVIDLSIDDDYKLVATLYDKNENLISTSTVIDLPIEQLVISVSFDSSTNELIITLKNGTTTRISLASIITGLATQQWVQQQGYLTSHQSLADYSTTAQMNTAISAHHDSTKQDSISDLATIRSGASAGADASATIATYGDIVTHDANEFLTEHQSLAEYAKTADLATVATTGSYTDLGDKPTIPIVPTVVSAFTNDAGYLTSHQSLANYSTTTEMNTAIGAHHDSTKQDAISDLASIRSGASAGATAVQPSAIADMATKTWVGNQGYLTEHQSLSAYRTASAQDTIDATKANTADLATVATSGSYNDLSNKPTIPSAQVQTNWNATSGMASILNKPTLATVATSGSYSDLSNKPSLATVATSGSYSDLSNKPTIPTQTSQLTNNSGFITNTTINRTTNVNTTDTNYSTPMARGIYAGTTDMTAGSTALTSGVIYIVYE